MSHNFGINFFSSIYPALDLFKQFRPAKATADIDFETKEVYNGIEKYSLIIALFRLISSFDGEVAMPRSTPNVITLMTTEVIRLLETNKQYNNFNKAFAAVAHQHGIWYTRVQDRALYSFLFRQVRERIRARAQRAVAKLKKTAVQKQVLPAQLSFCVERKPAQLSLLSKRPRTKETWVPGTLDRMQRASGET